METYIFCSGNVKEETTLDLFFRIAVLYNEQLCGIACCS